MILSPCRKCIVRACCTERCQPYIKRKLFIIGIVFKLLMIKRYIKEKYETLWEDAFRWTGSMVTDAVYLLVVTIITVGSFIGFIVLIVYMGYMGA